MFRARIEGSGWRCRSRRAVYAELGRIIGRDRLRESHAPWADCDGEPGWYRMLAAVIIHYTGHEVSEWNSWYAHEDLAQPGTVTRIAGYLKDQAAQEALPGRAQPANTRPPTPERRARVRAFLENRKARRD